MVRLLTVLIFKAKTRKNWYSEAFLYSDIHTYIHTYIHEYILFNMNTVGCHRESDNEGRIVLLWKN